MTKNKTRCGSRWTEARFKSFITSALRNQFRRWQPKSDVLKDAFTVVKKNKASGRQARHYRCNICQRDFPQKQSQVDHIKPLGLFVSWDIFINNLFCEKDNLQVVCKPCHKIKTNQERPN